jgi:hypothetical protein
VAAELGIANGSYQIIHLNLGMRIVSERICPAVPVMTKEQKKHHTAMCHEIIHHEKN